MRRLIFFLLAFAIAAPLSAGTWTDVQYISDGTVDHRLDVYTPAAGGPFNVIVLIPGGAWQTARKESYLSGGRAVFKSEPLARNWAVVIINYRWAPTARWPRQIHDCRAAIRWIRANAATHNLRTDNIVASGHSAGGHLSAMLALTNGDPYYTGGLGTTGYSSSVTAAHDISGPTNLSLRTGFCTLDDQNNYMDNTFQLCGCQANAPLASPASHASASSAPIWVAHGDADCGIPYSGPQAFSAALATAGVPTSFRLISGGDHPCSGCTTTAEYDAFFAWLSPYLVP